MTDWEKLKVTELKEELKSRGVPLTGLKLKQQLIDKLVEVESAKLEEEEKPEQKEAGESKEYQDVPETDEDVATGDNNATEVQSQEQQITYNHDDSGDPMSSPAGDPDLAAPTEPSECRNEDTTTSEQDTKMQDADTPEGLATSGKGRQDEILPQAVDEMRDETTTASPAHEAQSNTKESEISEAPHLAKESPKLPTPDVLEDQRKRKRRSISSASDKDEIKKKAKTNNREGIVTRRQSEALEAIQAATKEVQDGRAPNDPDEGPIRPMEASNNPDDTRVAKDVGGLPDATELQDTMPMDEATGTKRKNTVSPEPSRYVTPAIHPATCSIYIRNFKRPLHIPTLRSYISDIAKSPSDPDADTIKIFYLDVIRTHAFVRFASISAASRVRNAMHETRFPDEQMREPLWIDFVPNEKVQTWIDQETGSTNGGFGGGRSSGRKYEVIYENNQDGVEAILRDLSESHTRPSFQQQRPSRISQDQTNNGSMASGVHPDRSGLVPTSTRDRDRGHLVKTPQSQNLPAAPKSDSGKGFKALDELFPSTATKPKLYYKPVSQSIASNRLNMIQNLLTGHNEPGRSGDEGMKRYTFEEYRGREEWVDKGPEFGFGRKGQERLEGFNGRGRGRGRGTGGFRGRGRGRGRGGDSWRGGR